MAKKTSKLMKLRNKADRLITKLYTGQPCIICKQLGIINTYRTCGHHCVNRSLSGYLRHDLLNIIPLCPSHHKFSNEIAAHSTYQPAQVAFVEWLRKYQPDRYDLLMNYKQMQGKIDYAKRVEELELALSIPPFGEDVIFGGI